MEGDKVLVIRCDVETVSRCGGCGYSRKRVVQTDEKFIRMRAEAIGTWGGQNNQMFETQLGAPVGA